jgi:hypothetical protein
MRTRGVVVAAVTALALGTALLLGSILLAFISALTPADIVPRPDGDMVVAGPQNDLLAIEPVVLLVSIVLGFFLCLWAIAPITDELGIGHVITRAVLACGVAATMAFVGRSLWLLLTVLVTRPWGFMGSAPTILGASLGTALMAFVVLIPLGVLAGILQWLWRAKHPSRHHISGIIDV